MDLFLFFVAGAVVGIVLFVTIHAWFTDAHP